MGKKRRKKGRFAKPIIIITSIALLNFIGISYAYWNDSLEIITSITTGRFGLIFLDRFEFKDDQGNKQVDSPLQPLRANRKTITIDGDIDPGYRTFMQYGIKNIGTIPAKFKEDTIIINGEVVESNNGLIKVYQQSGNLKPEEIFFNGKHKLDHQIINEEGNGNPKIEIDSENLQPGTYEFEIELTFEQLNR